MDENSKNGEKKYLIVEQANEEQKKKLKAVSKMDKKGNIQTVDATPENKHKFFEINPNDSMLEAFFKKMIEQADSPSHTGFYLVTAQLLDKIIHMEITPEELEACRVTPEGFLQEKQQRQEQEKAESSGKDTTVEREEQTSKSQKQDDGKAEEQKFQPLDVNKIDRNELDKQGIKWEDLEPHLKAMSYGHKSTNMIPMNPEMEDGIRTPTKGRVSLEEMPDGTIKTVPHYYQEKPNLDAPLHGIMLPEDVKTNLLETHNAGRVLDLELTPGVKTTCYVSLDKQTNGLEVLPASLINISERIKGADLSPQQQTELAEGKKVLVEGMTSRNENLFDGYIQINAVDKKFDFTYDGLDRNRYAQENKEVNRQQKTEPKQQTAAGSDNTQKKIFIPDKLLGVELSDWLKKSLEERKATWVKGMVNDKTGEPFNAWVKVNDEKGKLDFYKWNPDKAVRQGAAVKPAAESKVQHAVNNEGKTNEATKHIKKPLRQGQQQPTSDQKKKQEEKDNQGQRQYRKPIKKSGHKMS